MNALAGALAVVLAQSGAAPASLPAAAEVFEDLTEGAAALDDAGFKTAMAALDALRPALGRSMPADRKNALDGRVTGIREAWRKADRGGVANESIEAYRLLQETMDRKNARAPIEVALLDYAGFKSKALLLAAAPDWAQAAKAAREAAGWWAVLRPKVTDETLKSAMDHAIAGLIDAARRKDAVLLGYAAGLDLILVDGLEGFFAAH